MRSFHLDRTAEMYMAPVLLAALLSMALGACKTTKESSPVVGENSGDIGPQGGTVTVTSGPARGAQIVVPPGALASPVRITIRADDRPANLPQGAVAVGPVVRFGPDGQRFARPATVTLPVTGASNVLYTRSDNANAWSVVPGASYDAKRHVVVVNVMHFTFYCAGNQNPSALSSCQTEHQISCGWGVNKSGALNNVIYECVGGQWVPTRTCSKTCYACDATNSSATCDSTEAYNKSCWKDKNKTLPQQGDDSKNLDTQIEDTSITACTSAVSGTTTPTTPTTPTTAPASSVKWTDIYYQVLSPNCAVSYCHDSGSTNEMPVAGLDYGKDAQTAYDLLVNQPASQFEACANSGLYRVKPYDPENSLLYRKVNDVTPPCGVRMPKGAPVPLSSAQIQQIHDWIMAGAPNN